MVMRKMLDDAQNNILDIKKVDEVIKSCDEDKLFFPMEGTITEGNTNTVQPT